MTIAHVPSRFLKNNKALKRLGVLLPIISVVLGLGLLIVDPLPMQTLRNNVFDQYQRWYPRPYVDVPVRIVDIDEETLARLGQWPWPRTRLAELVGRLKTAGAATISFDVLLAEADRTSPRTMAKLWQLSGAARKALDGLPDHDLVLAKSFEGASVGLGFVLQRGAPRNGVTGAPDGDEASGLAHRPFRYISSGQNPTSHLHAFDSVIPTRPELEAAALGNGALNFVADSDGIVRRVPLVLSLSGNPVPSIAAESLRVAQGERNYFLKAMEQGYGLAEVRAGAYKIPTTAEGEVWVHYSGPVANRYLPAWKVLAGEVPDALLAGHIVFIGSSAQGLMDLRFTPLGGVMPGVEAHAQVVEQILSGHILSRPDWAKAAEVIAIIVGGLAISFLSIRARAMLAATVAAAFLSVALAGGWYAFREHALLINTVTPSLIFALAFVLGSLIHHFISEREQRWIKDMFSRYVSPNRVDYLVKHPEAMSLGGGRQECSFVFTDLANFTSLMESIDPGNAVDMLNNYLDQMIAIAFHYEGTLDRIVGDSVAIMFSAPVLQPDHRARALACALEMDTFAMAYAKKLNAEGVKFGITRIGIHSGEVIVGNFGGSTMFDYRALGDPVNTASRLESVNKQLGTNMCISAATLAGCANAAVRPVGRLVLKGKTEAIEVFEPLVAEREKRYAPRERYLDAYKQLSVTGGQAHAKAMFAELAVLYRDDPLVKLYSDRLERGEGGDLILMAEK
ncbi:CHASE2 domain-containing protein [Ferribacterium limneticum]|uniref:CHASE2 domain-containing protein n=1 Tax=Ferribacterium limneticum TaxID=76259 RepID=UPI001CF90C7C|nr:adenylate/guanylate cyclase domain-containing protein [Ferribacterium limneticum]UCV24344.1 adenylate/guanylate cyclase domain-containing protein [Ferribacterium limneticum]